MNCMNKALILDRDGVINYDHGYVYSQSNFQFISGIFELCHYFISLGYYIIIATNQGGIGKKLYSHEDFIKLNNYMINRFNDEGVEIKKVYYCPHSAQDNCYCRKPNPGMILNAVTDFDLDIENSILIGDKISDIQAGKLAGIKHCFLFKEENHFNLLNDLKKKF